MIILNITNNRLLNITIWFVFIFFSIIDIIISPASHAISWILITIELTSMIAIIKYPNIACTIILIVYILGLIIPLSNSALLWPFLYALMLLMFKDRKIQVFLSTLIMSAIYYYKWYFRNTDDYNPSGIVAISLLFIILGYQANNYNKKNIELRKTQKIRELELKENISINLHDSIANQLSFIILLAENEHNDSTNHGLSYSLIEKSAKSALQSTHQIINMLIDNKYNSVNNIQWVEKMLDLTTQSKYKLDAMKIYGRSSMQWESISLLSPEKQSFIFSLLEEIYYNIIKHCNQQCEYFITVKQFNDYIYISEINTVDKEGKSSPIFKSGRGLSFRKKQIEKFNGTLNYGQENMIWSLYARMPIS